MREIGLEDARRQLGEIVDRARLADQHTLITRQGKPGAVVVSAEWHAAASRGYQAVFTAIADGKNREAALVLRDLTPENLTELHVICGDVQIMVEADQRRRAELEGKQ